MAGPAVFVGREGELSRLLAGLHGDARLLLVVGDAGVGKTRFADEGMARATTAGMVVVRGECLPLAGALPLLPVAGALGELARREGGGLLQAALAAGPEYVRDEVRRLLPGLPAGAAPGAGGQPDPGGRDDGWRRERLFSAVADLLDAVAASRGSRVGLVVEDVHWADSATLDCLTFLARAGQRDTLAVAVTCRGDEAPLAGHVAEWLAQVRGAAGVEEIRLGPLSRAEVAGQVAGLAGGQVPARVVDELYARAEGNPFFTEQLVAVALADADGGLHLPPGLPGRLAELLAARAGSRAGDARVVLAGLAVAGRPLAEDLLGVVTGLDAEAVRGGLRELAAARLLAEDTAGGAHRPRHALLAEAVAGGLLPGERAALHESVARALAAATDQALAAEVAGHWQAAGNAAAELAARLAAAEAAEQVFGYAEAATHWQRAIELCRAHPDAAAAAAIELPRMYVHATDALALSGDGERAAEVAEEAYRRFAAHPDPTTAAVIRHRAAYHQAFETRGAALALIEEALRLYEQGPPSADHVMAWIDYATFFLWSGQARLEDISPALSKALQIAEAAGATALMPRVLAALALNAFSRGQADEGADFLRRARTQARTSGDGMAAVRVALTESYSLLRMARFDSATDVARSGLEHARQAGLSASWIASVLAFNASEALLACGRTAEARALIDPLTDEPPGHDHLATHEARAEIDLLRGDIDAAARRRQLIDAIPNDLGLDIVRASAQRAAELAVWAGQPGDAVERIRQVLPLMETPDMIITCGWPLTIGMRACADLAEHARARRDEPAAAAAGAAADGLATWVDRVSGTLFADHRFAAAIPAERATWEAERTRLAGPSDPEAWRRAAQAWQELGCPHRAGYAWWRQAQAQLDAGQPAAEATEALRAAAAAADGHAPLLAQVRALAGRARIALHAPAAASPEPAAAAKAPVAYGLTGRELAVLRLLAAGRTNAQIGAELYISPKTASVHVTSILRKLGVSGRVQAAALAERAGLVPAGAPEDGGAGI
jgi:DNA-binding CsgD family transcriptional regulator